MIAYRDAVPADGPALDAMARQSWIDTFQKSCSAQDMELYLAQAYGPEGALIRDLSDPAMHFHVAVEGTRIIGHAKLVPTYLADMSPATRQLGQLYVAADRLGVGVAPVLMDWAIAAARADGGDALVLTVWEGNARAQRFYARYGFVHVGDYAFQTGTQTDRDLILRLAL
jgi:GNAT superfamily N-acetyltransferase